jgi:hypothetical protein
MAIVVYSEVFMEAGETFSAWITTDVPFTNADPTPQTAKLPVWEPLPYTFFHYDSTAVINSTETAVVLTSENQLQFVKVLTNASVDVSGPIFLYFIFLVSYQ